LRPGVTWSGAIRELLLPGMVPCLRWLVAGTLAMLCAPCAWAETKVDFWHAMTGELRRELERLVADFNRSQPDARIVATAKGSYTETVTAAIFAVRTTPSRPSCK